MVLQIWIWKNEIILPDPEILIRLGNGKASSSPKAMKMKTNKPKYLNLFYSMNLPRFRDHARSGEEMLLLKVDDISWERRSDAKKAMSEQQNKPELRFRVRQERDGS